MRFNPLLVASVTAFLLLTACSSDDGGDRRPKAGDLVFGITQRTDPSTGETVTTAGYEYRAIGWEGGSLGPWAASVQSLPDGWCRRHELPLRATREHVGDGGRARFYGGALGIEPIVLDANGAEQTRAGAAFGETQPLKFVVDRGFGLPRVDPVTLPSVNPALRLSSPTADVREIVLDGGGDLSMRWLPSPEIGPVVMASLDSDDGATHLRCWFGAETGEGVVKADQLRGLGSAKLTIASQRPMVVTPGDGWVIHVISVAVVSEHRVLVR